MNAPRIFIAPARAVAATVILTMVLWLSNNVFAGTTASISGTVKDPSGATVSAATVTAKNAETGITPPCLKR